MLSYPPTLDLSSPFVLQRLTVFAFRLLSGTSANHDVLSDARLSWRVNMVAASGNVSADPFVAWTQIFYRLLVDGRLLNRAFNIAETTMNVSCVSRDKRRRRSGRAHLACGQEVSLRLPVTEAMRGTRAPRHRSCPGPGSPASLIDVAICKYHGEPAGIRVLRSTGTLWSRDLRANRQHRCP
jgi:hypothetical protein